MLSRNADAGFDGSFRTYLSLIEQIDGLPVNNMKLIVLHILRLTVALSSSSCTYFDSP